MVLREIYEPIEDELRTTERIIRDRLEAIARATVAPAAECLLNGGGKRIRPALVLLSAAASKDSGLRHRSEGAANLAAASELIHMASLIHDDVVDRASVRRGAPTVTAKVGPVLSVALGDYLYSMAWDLISGIDDIEVARSLFAGARPMCEGQLMQVASRGDFRMSEERCLEIAEKKTGSLFAASSRAGATTAGADGPAIDALTEYGRSLGIAFQIVDDYLDLVGSAERLGKPPGQDLLVGEMTLPLVYLRDRLPEAEREGLRDALGSEGSRDVLGAFARRLFDSGAAEATKGAALSYLRRAEARLRELTDSRYRESLLGLIGFVSDRGFDRAPSGAVGPAAA